MAEVYSEIVHVFGGEAVAEIEVQFPGATFARCTDPNASDADVLYHPNVLACAGEHACVCTDCGASTVEPGLA